MKSLLSLIAVLIISQSASAQIFGRIMDRATEKLEDKLEQELVERLSDEIARAAWKPVDKAVDDMFRERYVQDSIAGKTDRDYSGFMTAFLTPVDLPATYEFDISLTAETKDYDGDKNTMTLRLRKDGKAIGIWQEAEQSLLVFDTENDIMATYSKKDGKKQVTAFPSMLSMASQIAANEMEENPLVMEKTGKTKTIEGYKCSEWITEDEDTTSKVWVAEDFPASWKDSFKSLMEQVSPATSRENFPDGMMLRSETKTKKKGKKSTYEVKEIDESTYTVNNADYEQVSYDKQ